MLLACALSALLSGCQTPLLLKNPEQPSTDSPRPPAAPQLSPPARSPGVPVQPPAQSTRGGNDPKSPASNEPPPRAPPLGAAGDIPVTEYGRRLQLPATLPGANAAQIRLPPYDVDPAFRSHIVDLLFPNLPKTWPLRLPRPTAQQPALTLGELQELALQYNPMLIQASANVPSMLGDAIQAGTHPNPVVGYESDTVGSSNNRNYQGVYVQQIIKTANKLGLARTVANYDVMNAQQTLRKTRLQVLSQTKAAYFAVLVAEENVIVSSALVRFMDQVFEIQRSRAKGTEGAAFEPAQLRGLAKTAHIQLNLAQNSYISAWKTLAARLGLPQLEPRVLVGRADMPVPVISYEAALGRMLSVHPDIAIARNMLSKARTALKLEKVKPIPDVLLYGTVQKDFTTPGQRSTSYNTQVGLPLPLWDRNRGNILSATGDLGQAEQQLRRAQVELTEQLANTFAQYETNRYQLQMYAEHVLPDYARAYRGVYERHQNEPERVGFEDVILVQQNLAAAVATYIASLNGQWSAVADLAYLMQIEDLEDMARLGGGQPERGPEPIPAPPAEPRRPAPMQQGGRR